MSKPKQPGYYWYRNEDWTRPHWQLVKVMHETGDKRSALLFYPWLDSVGYYVRTEGGRWGERVCGMYPAKDAT